LLRENFIQAVIARENFRCLVLPVDPVCLTAGNYPYISFLSNKRARQFADQLYGCMG